MADQRGHAAHCAVLVDARGNVAGAGIETRGIADITARLWQRAVAGWCIQGALKFAGGGGFFLGENKNLRQDDRVAGNLGCKKFIARTRIGQDDVVDLGPRAKRGKLGGKTGQALARPWPGTEFGQAGLVDVDDDDPVFLGFARESTPEQVAGAFIDGLQAAGKQAMHEQADDERQPKRDHSCLPGHRK